MADVPAFNPTQPFEDAPAFDPSKPSEPVQESRSWGDVATSAVTNAPASAVKFLGDVVQPILHPIETAESLKTIGHGTLQKMGVMSGEENIPAANAVGQFFADRYGGWENFKKTLAEDPVGFAGDLSTVLTLGGGAAVRAPGLAGKVAQVAQKAGAAVDPLSAVAPVARGAGHLASEFVGGLGTHTGGESVRRAVSAGFEGGDAATAFRENMRGAAPTDDIVAEARRAVGKIKQERGEAYRSGMNEMANATYTAVLPFEKIDDALADITQVKTFKGQPTNQKTAEIRKEIGQEVAKWKALDPYEFHSPVGIDALKQIIGDIRDNTQYGTPARKVADDAYHAVRQTIVDTFPDYAKTMKGYEQASDIIREIERTLSVSPKASVDTALRKLQSVLRNNVNTNFGKRAELAKYLVNAGAPHLMEKLAGQAMNTWTPRGLGKVVASAGAAGGLGAALAGLIQPQALAGLALMSPRLVGEGGYYAGRVAKPLSRVLPDRAGFERSRQIGRVANQGVPFLAEDSSPFAEREQP